MSVSPLKNRAYLPTTSASYHVLRGGGFDFDATSLLPSDRYLDDPAGRNDDIGFRCARAP